MILRATFRNILSFKEETSISFVAGKSTHHASHVVRAAGRDDISVLKAGVIYGANASGKSNIIKAIQILKNIALGQLPKSNIEPFKLSEERQSVSKLEIEFKTAGRYFAYGVEFSVNGIDEEWLFDINARTDKEVFSRKSGKDGNAFTFGTVSGNKETTQFLKFLADGTPSNTSFLSEYVRRNGRGLDLIKEAFAWFKDKLNILFPHSRYQGISFNVERNKDFQEGTRKLLDFFDTGIKDIRRMEIKKEEIDIPSELQERLIAKLEPGRTVAITSESGSQTYFIDMGIDGTLSYISKRPCIQMMPGGR